MYKELISKQKIFFNLGKTLSYDTRIKYLKKLKEEIVNNEAEIEDALYKDLGKSSGESYMTEIGPVLKELNFQIKHLKKFMKPKKVGSPLALFPAKSYIYPEPLGTVLIISPWNYPFLLLLDPLIGAIAAGNTVIAKPSEFSTATTKITQKILQNVFEDEYVTVVEGEVYETTKLLEERFDYIFFTGSTNVGKIIMNAASKHLTPVTLELGGKSPAVIFNDADIKLAAKRIAFGKLINAGQTCIAPDYILIDKTKKEEFITYYKMYIEEFYTDTPLENDLYPKIISKKHFDRLISLYKDEDILFGGKYNDVKIEPTLLDIKDVNVKIMQEEIFGPILPILTFEKVNEVFEYLSKEEKPLAFYAFTRNKEIKKRILTTTSSGGLIFNDTLMHFANNNLPFGGVGYSGMGKYHGIDTFKTFSHYKAVVDRKTWLDINIRYQPITEKKKRIIKKINK
ncbi:aldehyde dehydrogenase [Haploplasma axanthum]|uniref:Aldehyde dehydrogenase n=1 Tax=Haploplasma axanthum TaxID=29552 RepID=A0A449BCX1_HAPAX|nr:aldehyde dehydrogenase [Haploplasma axanthum]VEU80286.1 NAD-dependent aldehyde dehydrogenase domain-containing protein [Haploplasma axanthum]